MTFPLIHLGVAFASSWHRSGIAVAWQLHRSCIAVSISSLPKVHKVSLEKCRPFP